MNILFLHPNFPGQFLHLARHFASMGGNRVVFLSKQTNGNQLRGVEVALYKPSREPHKDTHHYIKPLEEAVLDGQAVVRALMALRDQEKFVPDVIIGHTGWGSTLYCKDVYPDVPLLGYFEWYYNAKGSDVIYFPDETTSIDSYFRIRTRNAHHLLNLAACDVRFTPTEWQRAQFPKEYREGMQVIHEGVDTTFCCPASGGKLMLPKTEKREAVALSEDVEILTYVSRGFEPYRGYPQFMEAVSLLLKRRPNLHVILVGMDRTCYGVEPPDGKKSWVRYVDEHVKYDKSRVHFVGHLDRSSYQKVMQASTVHVYLTRPFILSWSMLEAMSFGCALVASKTPPVEEVVENGKNGLLANFRSPQHIAQRVEELLDDKELRKRLGRAARETILDHYDVKDCVRKQVDMIFGAMK
ncbi:glycosyltransferase [uncultured Selenomonas sp.]|uniref:glycosyltransferase n=1 Tax=uncultured Selenomonas sp. TaxID=159275 RepID=UPI0025F5FEB0|nr:glycosyltransferase [uncultured Selenomonas sp.]